LFFFFFFLTLEELRADEQKTTIDPRSVQRNAWFREGGVS